MKFVFDKRTECEHVAKAVLDTKIRQVEQEEKMFGQRRSQTESWACLPDTVDPRGPKGTK